MGSSLFSPVWRKAPSHILPLLALAMGAFACAPTTGATTVTAADVESPAARETSPAAAPSAQAAESTPLAEPAKPDGRSACRAKTPDGTRDLLLSWDSASGSGKGTLEHVAPSGNTTSQLVRAERYKGLIIADEPGQTDLVTHVAVVAEKDGKRYMRLGDDTQPWIACD